MASTPLHLLVLLKKSGTLVCTGQVVIKTLERARHGNCKQNINHQYTNISNERTECEVETVASLLCLLFYFSSIPKKTIYRLN